MLRREIHSSMVVLGLLGIVVGPARAQVAPAPAPTPGPADEAPAPTPAPTPAAPAAPPPAPAPAPAASPPAAPAASITARAPQASDAEQPPSPLASEAAAAKAQGTVIQVSSPEAVAACRQVGKSTESSPLEGVAARANIHLELRKTAVARGASHILYFDYSNTGTQSEAARFYDCTASVGTAAAAGGPTPQRAFAVQLNVIPASSLGTDFTGDVDLATTFGLSVIGERIVSSNVAVGLVTSYTFSLHGENAMSSASELDLQLRLRFGSEIADQSAFSAYLALGYSRIFFPLDVTSAGPTAAAGVMATFRTGDAFFLIDAGYQLGAQSAATSDAGSITASTKMFHLGVGLGSYY